MSAPAVADAPAGVRAELRIRGGAAAEEVAAVLAVLRARSSGTAAPGPTGLAAWRAGRRTALARTTRSGQQIRRRRGGMA